MLVKFSSTPANVQSIMVFMNIDYLLEVVSNKAIGISKCEDEISIAGFNFNSKWRIECDSRRRNQAETSESIRSWLSAQINSSD